MWLLFTGITVALWGLSEIFYKKGNIEREKYSHLKTTIFVGLVMGIHAIIVLLTQNINFDFRNILIYIPVSLCYIISMACSYFGVRFLEESVADPIENTSGAIVPILCALILHQQINTVTIIGIVVIVLGIVGVGLAEGKSNEDRKKSFGKKLAIWIFAMPFCYAILDAVGTFLDIYYLEMDTTLFLNVTEDTIENVANTCYELTFLFVAIVLIIFLLIKKVSLFKIDEEETEKNVFKKVFNQRNKIIAAIFETIGQFTYVFALSGNGAIASPIIGAGVVVLSLLLSRVWLKEKLTKIQYLFIFIVIIGIIIISIMEG